MKGWVGLVGWPIADGLPVVKSLTTGSTVSIWKVLTDGHNWLSRVWIFTALADLKVLVHYTTDYCCIYITYSVFASRESL